MPNIKMEPWRRTDIKDLQAGAFRLPSKETEQGLMPVPAQLLTPVADGEHGGEVILQPGGSRVYLDPELVAKGVVFTDLRGAEKEHAALLERIMGKTVRSDESRFAALAASLSHTGVLLYVPKGVEITQPLHSLLWGPGVNLAYLSHVLVWLEEGASVTYVHEAASPTEPAGQTLHSGLVEIHVGQEASLNFVELQSWGEHVWNFSHERAQVERDASLDWIFGAIGSHADQEFLRIWTWWARAAPGACPDSTSPTECNIWITTPSRTTSRRTPPATCSSRARVQDKSRSVWQGMIYVAPGAAKTDGYQANRNMVLSQEARAEFDPRPGNPGG